MESFSFEIPLDNEITAFDEHLQSHSRTIFSAPYGEGKSYFLDKFKNDEDIKAKYQFVTLYPVNYQIVENADIFELVKRDILCQMIYADMIPEDYNISEEILLQFYIINKTKELSTYLMEGMSSIPMGTTTAISKGILALNRFIDKAQKRYEQFKAEASKGNAIVNFVNKMQSHYLYENDSITSIIRECISEYKKENNKSVALLIEDMDRIDPAHLFRILNILSAHIDISYKYGLHNEESLINKFDFDNIVLVLNYKSTKHIFEHLYGPNSEYDAYMGKFLSANIFKFSLQEVKKKYIYNYLSNNLKIGKDLLEGILPYEKLFENRRMRDIANAINNPLKSLKRIPQYVTINETIELNATILQLLVIIIRLGKIEDCHEVLYNTCLSHTMPMFGYLGGYIRTHEQETNSHEYILLREEDDWRTTQRPEYHTTGKRGNYAIVTINGINPNGTALVDVQRVEHLNDNKHIYNIDKLTDYLLSFICK